MADKKVLIPDIGGANNVNVIEIFIKPGDQVEKEQPLITLEGDKATMEIPAPFAGKVKSVSIKINDKVSEGSEICVVEIAGDAAEEKKPAKSNEEKVDQRFAKEEEKPVAKEAVKATEVKTIEEPDKTADIHAGPGARRLARELDLDIKQISGSGEKGRITKEDIQQYVKNRMQSGGGFGIPAAPIIDFSQFGEIELKELSKIKKITATNMHRNWVSIPHVTQFDSADITELEIFRQAQKNQAEKKGYKLTPLVFIMKAVVKTLQDFPQFNSSLDPSGEKLILKKYFHIGVAVDTPNGLVVPVIRDVDQKGVFELAKELAEISEKARTKGLSIKEMQGGCFTISSLGGIGGTAFTPIINQPEVAILGVSKSSYQPVWQKDKFEPRLMLPLSLSYDHRVIDGAEAARFIVKLCEYLSDIRTILL